MGVVGEISLGVGWLTKKHQRLSGNITKNRNPGCLENPGSLPKSIRQKNQDEIYLDIRKVWGENKIEIESGRRMG